MSQIELELRDAGQWDYAFEDGSITQCLPMMNKRALSSLYDHTCLPACEKKACKKMLVIDGMWKIGYRICAARIQVPVYLKMYCSKHEKGRKHECSF